MVAPQAHLAPAHDVMWARKKEGGAAHMLRRSQDGWWQSPCGWISSKVPVAVDAEGAALCGRCVQLDSKPDPLEKCGGCSSLLCTDCNRPTEARMLGWLRRYYLQQSGGNGDRYMFASHVRSHAGFDARTADAVAMDLWKSKGLQLHGHEVKISRGDWQNELRDPEKWRGVGRYMDRWWLAISDLDIVRGGELPASWGLMLVTPTTVHVIRKAPKLEPVPVDRSFLAALVRAAAKTCGAR